jgi:hypothetical protein
LPLEKLCVDLCHTGLVGFMRRDRSVQVLLRVATRHMNPRVHLHKRGTSRNSYPHVFIGPSGQSG